MRKNSGELSKRTIRRHDENPYRLLLGQLVVMQWILSPASELAAKSENT